MSVSRVKNIAIRTTILGALIGSVAGVAAAQKVKPATPPATTHGMIKSSPKADKGQATAEHARAEARHDEHARAEARHDEHASAEAHHDRAERLALGAARGEPKLLLHGIKLSNADKKTTGDIEKRYADELKNLEKAENSAAKAGTPDAALIAKIDALRLHERAELRAALTPEQQAVYDHNIAALSAKKK